MDGFFGQNFLLFHLVSGNDNLRDIEAGVIADHDIVDAGGAAIFDAERLCSETVPFRGVQIADADLLTDGMMFPVVG